MAPRGKMVIVHPVHGYHIKPQEDLKTIKRNARERSRVQNVNSGFDTLKLHIPSTKTVKKMSKVNILNAAVDYIQYLHAILTGDSDQPQSQSESAIQSGLVTQSDLVQKVKQEAQHYRTSSESGYESFYSHSPGSTSTLQSPRPSSVQPSPLPAEFHASYANLQLSRQSGLQSPALSLHSPALSLQSQALSSPALNLHGLGFHSPAAMPSIPQGHMAYQPYAYRPDLTYASHHHQQLQSHYGGGSWPSQAASEDLESEDDDVLEAIVDWQTASSA